MAQIFVSYAHDDNRTMDESQRGWVSHFYLALEQELIERGLLDLNLWRDKRETRPFEQFADDIEAGLEASDLLLSILSPVYIQKEWCTRELNRFAELLEGRDRAQRERIVKIVKREVPLEKTPGPLQGQEGYRFFEYSPEDSSEIPFYRPGRGALDQYWDVVGKIAEDIAGIIEERLRDGGSAVGPANVSAVEPGSKPEREASKQPSFTVYLAPATTDLMDESRRLRGELEAAGACVRPAQGESLPTSADALRATVEAGLADADLSVHLLGATPGFTPDGSEKPMVELQLEAAATAGRRRVIWCPRLPDDRSPRLETVIDALRNGHTLNATDELVEEGFDRFMGFALPLVSAAMSPEPDPEPLAAADPQAMLQALLSQLPEDQLARLLEAKRKPG